MTVNTVELRNRLQAQMASRSTIDSTWDQVEKWVGPLAGGSPAQDGVSSESSVAWQRANVWDSTAPVGAGRLAASIYTNITNPALRWVRLEWEAKELQDDTEAASWLDNEADGAFADLAESDFYTEVASFYQEWARFNTACFVAEVKKDALTQEEWKGFDFTSPPIRECYYEPDSSGAVFRFWRVLNWTATQIISKFPEETIPAKIKQRAAQPDASAERFQIAYSVWVRPEEMEKPKKAPLAPDLRPVGTCYFLVESGEMIGEEGGLYEMPVYIVPWERAAGSIWGHGPGIQCLPDVRYLNSRLEQQRSAGEKAVDPAIATTERGLMSDLDLKAGGITVFRSMEDFKPIESASKFDVGEHDIADLRAQIRAHFWTDELTLKLSPQMTATEVNARIDQMNRLFGPTLAALQSMMLDPLIQFIIAARYRAGRMATMPANVRAALQKGNGSFAIKYQGPLSRAQRTDEVAGIERVASAASAMLKMGFQKVALVFNEEQALREIAKRLGTPATILYSEKDVKAKVKAQEDQQRRMVEAEIAKSQGQAMNQAAQAGATGGNGVSTPASPAPLLTPELM